MMHFSTANQKKKLHSGSIKYEKCSICPQFKFQTAVHKHK